MYLWQQILQSYQLQILRVQAPYDFKNAFLSFILFTLLSNLIMLKYFPFPVAIYFNFTSVDGVGTHSDMGHHYHLNYLTHALTILTLSAKPVPYAITQLDELLEETHGRKSSGPLSSTSTPASLLINWSNG